VQRHSPPATRRATVGSPGGQNAPAHCRRTTGLRLRASLSPHCACERSLPSPPSPFRSMFAIGTLPYKLEEFKLPPAHPSHGTPRMSDDELMTQGAGDGSDEGACADCSQSPGVLSPGAEVTKPPAKKGRQAKDAAPKASKSKASEKPKSAAEPERSSARSRQPPPFLKALNFKVPSKAKAPKKKTAKAKPAPKQEATGKSAKTKPAPKAKGAKKGVMPKGSKSKPKATA